MVKEVPTWLSEKDRATEQIKIHAMFAFTPCWTLTRLYLKRWVNSTGGNEWREDVCHVVSYCQLIRWCQKITGLRRCFANPQEASIIASLAQEAPELPLPTKDVNNGSFLFAFEGRNYSETPPPGLRTSLPQIYKDRVDPLLKVTFWPITSKAIEKQYKSGYNGTLSPSLQALEFAVYFLAACSIDTEDVEADPVLNKHRSLSSLRTSVEMLFTKAKLLQQPNLTSLQAFVVYLVSRPIL